MTWYPPGRRRPCPCDFRDTSPPILDWISGEYRPPRHNDNTRLETIAGRIIQQCAATARAAKRSNKRKSPT
jgi:hypothetical protein